MLFRRKSRGIGRSSKTGQTLRQVQVPADAVRLGMRVVGLDRPWTDVPILFQQFAVETASQLATLRRYCLSVTVEMTEDQYRLVKDDIASAKSRKLKALPEEKSLGEELVRARESYEQARKYIDQLLRDVANGQPFDLVQVRSIIQSCVTSIMANANAMFWLSRIRHQDAYTAEHCLRVGILAISFGRFLDLPPEELEVLGLCGMLHDIGKMRIPPEVLNKPGALTKEEMDIMKTHPQHGFDLLGSHHQLAAIVRDATLSHHERMDGQGYPNALPSASISRYARIISIVDAYDAITSDRCYKKGAPAAEALRILYKCGGTQFDKELVEVFIKMIGLYPPGSLVEMSSGEVAVVLSTDPNQKLRPLLELVLDNKGYPCESRVIRLEDEPLDPTGQPYRIARPLPDGIHGFTLQQHIERQTRLPLANAPTPGTDAGRH